MLGIELSMQCRVSTRICQNRVLCVVGFKHSESKIALVTSMDVEYVIILVKLREHQVPLDY